MASRLPTQILLVLMLAGAGFGQTPPQSTAGSSRIYILLKPALADSVTARDAFTQRMTAAGAVNLQFVTGANAARCEAPATAQAAILADADVAAVLPMDAAPAAAAPPTQAQPQVQPPAQPAASPVQVPPISTPPYIPPPPSIPMSAGVPMGGGMNAGMAMLTDFAGNMVVKLLSPGSSCKIRLHGAAPAIPADGGSGAFEVKASGNCAWQAVSTADWLQVKTEVNASGTVAVVYTAARNSTGHRQAVVVIQPVPGMGALKGHTVTLVAQQ